MKKLYLIRHAKSSWEYRELTDFERPLNKRGRRDAPFMANLLAQKKIKPEIIISSPANRAITTAKFFCDNLNYSFDNIALEPRLYEASSEEILEVICDGGDSFNSIMIFSHNPGLTDFANRISEKHIDNIPTCGVLSLGFKVTSWDEVNSRNSEIIFFEYPKKYFK